MTTTSIRAALVTALRGRVADPTALVNLDPDSLMIGEQVDPEAVRAWVAANSTPEPTATAQVGAHTLETGRAVYDQRHRKPALTPADPVLPYGADAYALRHPNGIR